MRVSINLATRPYTDLGPALRRLRFAIIGLAVIAVALALGLHFMHNAAEAARASEHTVDQSIAKVNNERQQYITLAQQPDNAKVLAHVSSLNKLIDAKAFSWTLAMEDLETVLPGGVQVTTLEPVVDKKDGHITVRMRVVGPRDKAVDLVANLEHSKRFLLPRIVNETAESAGNGNQQQLEPVSASSRVNFDLLADYNPATPEERKTGNSKAQTTHSAPAEREQTPTRSKSRRPPVTLPPVNPRTGRPGQVPAPRGFPTGQPATRQQPATQPAPATRQQSATRPLGTVQPGPTGGAR
jgi:type IV pilus assembly protein PilN